jgi:hypothetical protein
MEIIRHTTGPHVGAISVVRTIATMAPGDTWNTHSGEVQLAYAQVACSRYGILTGRRYSVSSPRTAEGEITITRVE